MAPPVGLAEADGAVFVLAGLLDAVPPKENEDSPEAIERSEEEAEIADDARDDGEDEAKDDAREEARGDAEDEAYGDGEEAEADADGDEEPAMTTPLVAEDMPLYSDIDAEIVFTVKTVLIGDPLEEITVAKVVGIPDAKGEEAPTGKLAEAAELASTGAKTDEDSDIGRSA